MPGEIYRTVFMGTPEFAVPALSTLLAAPDFAIVGVVTQPDRPAGRGNRLTFSPVKQAALEASLPLIQPEKLRAPGVFEQLQAWAPDLIVVAAFGQILRQYVLSLPRYGCINVHASLLPRWRGAAPIQAAIRAGDSQTGITIMKMDAGLDTGAMLQARAVPITRADTGGTLHDKLADISGPLLIETLRPYLSGALQPKPQDETQQTYAPMLKKEDGLIDWGQPAKQVEHHVRAFDPWPGSFTLWERQVLKIIGGDAIPGAAPVGRVTAINGGYAVGTGEGLFQLDHVQIAGKAPVPFASFVNGHAAIVDAQLGVAPPD